MIGRMVTSALFAGIAAGLIAGLLHLVFVQKYLLLGETYESGAAVHFDGVKAGGHDTAPGAVAQDEAAPGLGDDAESSGLRRNGMTLLFSTLLFAAYGLIMVAGFGVAGQFGQRIAAREGILWGIAGFVALQMAPALGLAPALPGTAGPDLSDRQVWWAATVVLTAVGLALIGYGRKPWWIAGAVVLLAVPHLIGAPELNAYSGVAPPEVAAAFAVRTLAVGLVAWSVLGWLAGWMWDRAET